MTTVTDFDSLAQAIHYANTLGFAVFPVHGIKELTALDGKVYRACTCGNTACASPGKHPAIAKGLTSASRDEAVLENLWAGRKGLNLAIATGVVSGVFVVDVDGEHGANSLKELPALPRTLTCRTARGHHYYFRYPENKVHNRTHVWRNIDIRGEGGYVVAADSRHIEGVSYEWLDINTPIALAPQWLLDKVCADKKAPVVRHDMLNNASDLTWDDGEVRDMLTFLKPDMDYNSWISVGMALHDGGYHQDVWDEWSQKSELKKYKGTTNHWRSFKDMTGGITMGTLVDMAKLNGWKPKEYVSEPIDWDTHPAREWAINMGIYKPKGAAKKATKQDDEPQKLDPRAITGLVGETVEWICGTAVFEQPEMAMLNTFAALGAVFGRRFASTTDIRTNLYCCSIGNSTSGKDHSRKMIDKLMTAAGLETFLAGETMHSGSGLVTQLERQPSHLMMIDEFGMVLSSITGNKAQSHQIDISTKMLNLFTSNNRAWRGGTYADKKTAPTVIYEPNLCIYGTTTLETYLEALKKIAISSGMMNRFIVLPGREKPEPRFDDRSHAIPDDLLEKWRALGEGGMEVYNKNIINVPPRIVEWGTGCKEYYDELLRSQVRMTYDCDDALGILFGRYREITTKMAMILALCRDTVNPQINLEDFGYAENIVKTSIMYVKSLASEFMYENDQEKRKRDVAQVIRLAKKDGISKGELINRTGNLKGRERDEILRDLLEEGLVSAERKDTKVCYFYMGKA